jgi:hypothetical protein
MNPVYYKGLDVHRPISVHCLPVTIPSFLKVFPVLGFALLTGFVLNIIF